MRFHVRSSMALALTAAVALTSLNLAPAQAAASKASGQQVTENTGIDFSARRRHRGNRAALGAAIGVFGAIAAIAAAERYRDRHYYDDRYYYRPYSYGGPYSYGPVYPYYGFGHRWR